MADLEVELAGIKLKNPILLSSAEPTFNFEAMQKGIDTGIGGVIAKSFSDVPSLKALEKKPLMSLLEEKCRIASGKIPDQNFSPRVPCDNTHIPSASGRSR